MYSYTQNKSLMTPNNNEFGYIVCWTNAFLDNIIKINMSQTEPENSVNEFEYLERGILANDVIAVCKRVRNPVSKLNALYNLLDEYRVYQTKPLFECELDIILDIMNRTVY
jgi:hypothetical protein